MPRALSSPLPMRINVTMAWLRVLLVATLLMPPVAALATPPAERAALVTLWDSWRKQQPSGAFAAATIVDWPIQRSTSEPCATAWQGITCSCGGDARPCAADEAPHVTAIALPATATGGARLYGTLADVLAALPRLQSLDVSNQRLFGPLPASLFAHPALASARLDGNLFSGSLLPVGVREVTAPLATLDVRYNALSGEVPPALCGLRALALDGNAMLCGQLPPCFAQGAELTAAHTGAAQRRSFAGACVPAIASPFSGVSRA